MIKKFLIIFLVVFISFGLVSCKKRQSLILFNKYPITSENILSNSTIFKTDERIYYVYMTNKSLNTPDIRIKIYKRNEKANYGYGDVVYSNTFRLKDGEVFYYTDYIVFHKAGTYIMHVYRMDDLWKPDAIADFKVNEE